MAYIWQLQEKLEVLIGRHIFKANCSSYDLDYPLFYKVEVSYQADHEKAMFARLFSTPYSTACNSRLES